MLGGTPILYHHKSYFSGTISSGRKVTRIEDDRTQRRQFSTAADGVFAHMSLHALHCID